ncbi:hypothetical protein llh_0770 [Lactococcus cremoris subsp. cremoris A76]|uniref:hypothetical protein n=1 Tax=Lactococcus lactis subsp. cremoris TaxID=1359 RepID=UPI000238D280|nr:hypothetical protein llh_0770 [Lactococcus cremoris subsp. cremoris A76]
MIEKCKEWKKLNMKKGIIAFLTVLTILLTGAVKVSADSTQAEIYRLYNKNTGEHFYTSRPLNEILLTNQVGLTKE